MTLGSNIDPRALVEMEIEVPASEIPELTQANLIECLRYSAFKLCGKGPQEDYASDAMSMAIKEIEKLRSNDILYYEMPGGIRFPVGKAVRGAETYKHTEGTTYPVTATITDVGGRDD